MDKNLEYVYGPFLEIGERLYSIDREIMNNDAVSLYEICNREDMTVNEKLKAIKECYKIDPEMYRKYFEKLFSSKLHTIDVTMGRSFTPNGCGTSSTMVCADECHSEQNDNTLFLFLLSVISKKNNARTFKTNRNKYDSPNTNREMGNWMDKNIDEHKVLDGEYMVLPVRVKELSRSSNTPCRTNIMQYTCIVISRI